MRTLRKRRREIQKIDLTLLCAMAEAEFAVMWGVKMGAGSMWLRAICSGLGTQLKAVKHGVYLILITLAA